MSPSQKQLATEAVLKNTYKVLLNLNKASNAVYKEILEFERPVSPEVFEWWQDAMNQAGSVAQLLTEAV